MHSRRVSFGGGLLVGASAMALVNVTHQAANPGTSPMRVIEVELK
jgi:hypothetical protein